MLISMHSILGWVNDCINAAWHGGDQPVALLSCNEAQAALISVFRTVIFIVGSGVSRRASGQVSLLANQVQ